MLFFLTIVVVLSICFEIVPQKRLPFTKGEQFSKQNVTNLGHSSNKRMPMSRYSITDFDDDMPIRKNESNYHFHSNSSSNNLRFDVDVDDDFCDDLHPNFMGGANYTAEDELSVEENQGLISHKKKLIS